MPGNECVDINCSTTYRTLFPPVSTTMVVACPAQHFYCVLHSISKINLNTTQIPSVLSLQRKCGPTFEGVNPLFVGASEKKVPKQTKRLKQHGHIRSSHGCQGFSRNGKEPHDTRVARRCSNHCTRFLYTRLVLFVWTLFRNYGYVSVRAIGIVWGILAVVF